MKIRSKRAGISQRTDNKDFASERFFGFLFKHRFKKLWKLSDLERILTFSKGVQP